MRGIGILRPLSGSIWMIVFLFISNGWAGDWPSWRGIHQNGHVESGKLVENWSAQGENLIWRQDYVGRSTPIVMNGRVYVIGRTGEGASMQERVTCFDARDGKQLWEHRYNVRNTYVPFNRIGWASMVGDPETGKVYSMGGGGILYCFSKDGKILWERSLIEEFGIRTGYGGRTTNPVIDEDRVIVGFVSAGWGDQKPMTSRHYAFDKKTGATIWMATPGRGFKAPNLYSNPVIAVIDGVRLFIAGNANGSVYALQSRTGQNVWEFELSKRGLNSSVVVDGYRVYAAHGEENIDTANMGRIVCIDGRGKGNITETHELWRFDAEIGYTSPLLANGRVYYVDNAANMYALDAETGEMAWDYSLGTVGKASPVWADGKIYAPETNGRIHILKDNGDQCVSLDADQIMMPAGDRHAEIYGSPAIAYNRIYLATEEGVYCLGNREAEYKVTPSKGLNLPVEEKAATDAVPAFVQVLPAEILASGGEKVKLTARTFDEKGRLIGVTKADWRASDGLGKMDAKGQFTATSTGNAAGAITATLGNLTGTSRVRVFSSLPWKEDFENYPVNENPPYWIGASSFRSPGGRYIVADLEGNKVLMKPPNERGIQRHFVFFGPSNMKNYVIQADVRTDKDKRRLGDAGLVANGYVLDFMGKKKRVELRSWTSENRIREMVDMVFEPDVWYTMKLTIDYAADKATVMGKIWKKGSPEPAAWTITVEDPYPTPKGSPGLYGVSYAKVYFDNVIVTDK